MSDPSSVVIVDSNNTASFTPRGCPSSDGAEPRFPRVAKLRFAAIFNEKCPNSSCELMGTHGTFIFKPGFRWVSVIDNWPCKGLYWHLRLILFGTVLEDQMGARSDQDLNAFGVKVAILQGPTTVRSLIASENQNNRIQ